MDLRPLHRIARGQHGVISLVQASRHGVGRPEWRALVADGVLHEVFPDVALALGAAATDLGRITAATLAMGDTSLASHRSSLAVWGVPCRGVGPIDVIVRGSTRSRAPEGIRVHRPKDLVDLEPIMRSRIRTTRPLRSLCDLGAVEPGSVPVALDHFLMSGMLRPDTVRNALGRHRGKGRAGVVALEQALDALALGNKPPDSVLESKMAALFVRHGLPPFEFHARVAGFEVDFLITGTRIIVETDGWSTHGLLKDQFERDRARDADLGHAGYIVRRFTWTQVTTNGRWVADRIRGLIEQWSPHVLAA